jgi:transposase
VAVIQSLNIEIAKLEARLRVRVRLRRQYRVLITVPGIGEVLATLIMLETGAIERFAR